MTRLSSHVAGPRARLLLIALLGSATFPVATLAQSADADPDMPDLPPTTGSVLPRADAYASSDAGNPDAPLAASQPATGLVITPQIAASEGFTTNTNSGGTGSDFVTLIQPSLTVQDSTQRFNADLTYAPVGEIFARNGAFDQIEQMANGGVQLVAVPSWLYLDARGSVSEQSVYGGFGTENTVAISPHDRELNTSFSLSPYVSHRFAGIGTATAGVGYVYSATDAPGSASLGNDPALSGLYGSSYLATKRAFASFTTGEDFGRWRDRIGTDDNFFNGAGALNGTHRLTVTNDTSYAITRQISLVGEIGYENLDYLTGHQVNPVPLFNAQGQELYAGYVYDGVAYPFSQDYTAAQLGPVPAGDILLPAERLAEGAATFGGYRGITGAGGVQLTPGRHSVLLVEYRYLDGFGGLYARGWVQLSPRIVVTGGYSEGITSFQEDQQDALLNGPQDGSGVAASALVAAPLENAADAFGSNQNLVRLRRGDISISYTLSRDVFTLTGAHEHSDPVGFTLAAQSGVTETAGLNWTHALSETASLSAGLGYTRSQGVLTGEQATQAVSASVGLDKSFSPTLSAYVRLSASYTLSDGSGQTIYGTGHSTDATAVIGAVKRF